MVRESFVLARPIRGADWRAALATVGMALRILKVDQVAVNSRGVNLSVYTLGEGRNLASGQSTQYPESAKGSPHTGRQPSRSGSANDIRVYPRKHRDWRVTNKTGTARHIFVARRFAGLELVNLFYTRKHNCYTHSKKKKVTEEFFFKSRCPREKQPIKLAPM